MSVLSDRDIHRLCALGMVEPYIIDNVQPASIDLRLGHEFILFDDDDEVDMADVRLPGTKSSRGSSLTMKPGEFALGVTKERVNIPIDLVARIEGKSSIGRLGIMVHVTAGFIDPGFCGNITLEIVNLRSVPVTVRPGMEICQLSFHRMETTPQRPYAGRYQGADGVQASRY
jgi:dCTP deaminase